jgi:hypothetical protein
MTAIKSVGRTEFPIVIDYSMTLKAMIKAGHYAWINAEITERYFRAKDEGRKETKVELIHFNHVIKSHKAEDEFDRMGLRPATIEELLAFGAAFPEIQRKFPIIALYASAKLSGSRYLACLNGNGSERNLCLTWQLDDWGKLFRFLATRK